MARRSSASILKSVTDSNNHVGITITEDDMRRIALLARWYSLSPEHLAREELPENIWNPDINPNIGAEEQAVFASKVYGIKRRLARLARVVDASGQLAPLIEGGRFDYRDSTWFTTPHGASTVELPWKLRSTINPQQVSHAWFAADVGLQIERLGVPVLSERELSTGINVDGAEIGFDFNSEYMNPNTGAITNKKPDVAVLAANGEEFIAVEVEKYKGRSATAYIEKMKAYSGNTKVKAVWYICSSAATANRVGQSATKVFGAGSSFPLRIRIVEGRNGWMGIEHIQQVEKLMADLEAMK